MDDFTPTKEQLDRAKQTLLWLINKDNDVIMAIKNAQGRCKRKYTGTPLAEKQVIDRIRSGCSAYMYKGEPVAYRLAEINNLFKEYSTHDIRRVIDESEFFVKEIQKADKGTRKLQRYLVLHLYKR